MSNCNNISEPQSGFRIAFNMFDTDGNERVDKNEFLVVSNSLISYYLEYLIKYYKLKQIRKLLAGKKTEDAIPVSDDNKITKNCFSYIAA